MKILYVIPVTGNGGIEKLVINWAKFFLLQGHEIEILSFNKGINNEFSDFKVYFLEDIKSRGKSIREKLSLFFRDNQFDIVHSHVNLNNGVVAKTLFNSKHTKVISHSHTDTYSKFNSVASKIYHMFIYKWYKKYIVKYSDMLISCSIKSGLFMFGTKTNFEILYNAVDTKKFIFDSKSRSKIRNKLSISENEKVIIHIGRYNDQKNHNFLIQVFKKLLDEHPKIKMILIGDGENFIDIQFKIKQYKLMDNIILIKETNEINEYLSASDLFILPSKFEGFPISIIEAQINGLDCIISTNITSEVVINENVFSLKLNQSIDEWCKLISKVLYNEAIETKRINHSNIVSNEKFDLNYQIEALYKIYNRLENQNNV
ncbi:glycosyltransferase [Acholeplasma equirhinis]|uniref:glycosyltransferase n=1 Tax=Acholeplasma equirhinis TaxID=555393 RepID=UPI00197AEE27|nr:glycosyltransferase [Acholeplasma equirhinis]MBN3489975.1 glycosyltransferase [Acholeplasma equirhinis]